MIRRPPRSTLDRSSAASDVYKRQVQELHSDEQGVPARGRQEGRQGPHVRASGDDVQAVSYTHLRAHETVLDLVCRLLLEKKKSTSH